MYLCNVVYWFQLSEYINIGTVDSLRYTYSIGILRFKREYYIRWPSFSILPSSEAKLPYDDLGSDQWKGEKWAELVYSLLKLSTLTFFLNNTLMMSFIIRVLFWKKLLLLLFKEIMESAHNMQNNKFIFLTFHA